MADEPPLRVVPLSKGIRRTRSDVTPFAAEVGEALEANCGVYSLEGGFRQHGGISQYSDTAAGGAIVWMKRWYKPDGTRYFLALSSDGTLHLVSDSQPATLTTLYSGLSGTPFSTAEINGWIYLGNGIDPFLRYDGTDIFVVGADPPSLGGMNLTEIAGGGTFAAGTYRATVTYEYGDEGVLGESNPAGGSVSVTVAANAAISVNSIPVSGRADVHFKNIYLTLKDGDIFYWRTRIPNSQTNVTLDDGDALLSSANFQLEEDHDIPPRLKNLAVHRGRVFGEDPNVPGRVRFSLVLGSDVFPDDPVFYSDELGQDGEELVGLFRYGEGLYGAKKGRLWVLTGTTNSNFLWDEVPNSSGVASGMSITRGDGLVYCLGQRDILVFDGQSTLPLTQVRGLLDQVDEVNKPSAIGAYRDKKFYLAVQTGSDTRRSLILVVHSDPQVGGTRFEVSTFEREYTEASTTTKFQVSSFAAWEQENDRFFIGGYDGYIYEADIGTQWNRVGESAVGADFHWKSNWIWGQGPAQFERYLKAYIMIESAGGEMTFDYEIMTDDPNTLSIGSGQAIDLNPTVTAATERVARWNFSRWG